MENKNISAVYILGCEAKDLYEAKQLHFPTVNEQTGQCLGYVCENLKRFKNTLDYSLDLIKLKEISQKHYGKKKSFFYDDKLGKEFTRRVVCVNFDLAYKEFNKHGDIYIKNGYSMADIKSVGKYGDTTFYKDGVCIGVKVGDITDENVNVVWNNVPEYFKYDKINHKIKLCKNIPTLMSRSDLRKDLYENGFTCNGIEFVRYKRSSGSSRVGKCLFIDKNLYPDMHKWELCGLNIKEDDKIDLAAFEAYISLPSSSCIDTLEIKPENILIIDDYESEFDDDVVAVYGEGEKFVAKEEKVRIKNSIFDGQSLMDESLYSEKYSSRTMLLLRNRFFKSACFKTKIQNWFRDNGITDVSQLNGYTRAVNIEDIKLITTPSSIKYVKFGTLDQWLDNLYTTFGIVKYEKATHYVDGKLVQCHYQLLNTLQLSRENIQDLLQPNFNYLNLIRKDPAVMRYHLKYPYTLADNNESANTKDEIIMKVMGMNSKFADTKLYDGFRKDLTKAMLKNYRNGHILISGNYETLLGNGVEMLQHAIGTFKGESVLGVGNIHTKRFPFGKKLLGTRSPHINSGNILLVNNQDNDLINKYFILSEEICYVNAIGENTLQRLNGADYDSDCQLITDNPILIAAAEKNYHRFKVPTCFVEAKKIVHHYTNEDKSKLDVRTSVNKIGEIVNLSQYLNSIMWENIYTDIHNGSDAETAFNNQKEIYLDICILAVSSGVEIDSAKREFDVDITKMLNLLKKKYAVYTEVNGKQLLTKPMFFKNITIGNGYSLNGNHHFRYFETSMDYLQKAIDRFRADKIKNKNLSFYEIIKPIDIDWTKATAKRYKKVNKVIEEIKMLRNKIQELYIDYHNKSKEEKSIVVKEVSLLKSQYVNILDSRHFSEIELYLLLREIDKEKNSGYARTIFNTLFSMANPLLYDMIRDTSEGIYKITKKTNENSVDLFGYTYFKKKIG